MAWTCKGKTCGPCGRLHETEAAAKYCCSRERQRWLRHGHAHFDRSPQEVSEADAKRLKLSYQTKRAPGRI
jgi:hypothetical protein